MNGRSTILLWTALLFTGTALAKPTSQQQCDYARITAWKAYTSCIETVVAKDAKGVTFEEYRVFAKCRHAYFKKWSGFQAKTSLVGSTCIGVRLADNGDGTATDNLTRLVWEKKTNLNGAVNFADPHDADNLYTWSTGSNNRDGTTFTSFLAALNAGGGFAGANGWRLPTLAELQSILLDFTCKGFAGGPNCHCYPSIPCIDETFDAANTQSSQYYWSTTNSISYPNSAWSMYFYDGYTAYPWPNINSFAVRAVRGGL